MNKLPQFKIVKLSEFDKFTEEIKDYFGDQLEKMELKFYKTNRYILSIKLKPIPKTITSFMGSETHTYDHKKIEYHVCFYDYFSILTIEEKY